MLEFLGWCAGFVAALFGVATIMVLVFKYMSWLIDLVGGF